MGEAGLCLPETILVNSAQGAEALWDGKCWGEGGRPLCAPRAPTYPCHRLPKGAPSPLSSFSPPWCCY